MESVCYDCKFYCYLPAKTNAPPEDCYPSEDWCEEDMNENFMTEGGCWQFEQREDD